MKELLVIILLIVLLGLVAIRKATENFKRLRMGCFFDLQARDFPPLDTRHSIPGENP